MHRNASSPSLELSEKMAASIGLFQDGQLGQRLAWCSSATGVTQSLTHGNGGGGGG